MTSNGIIAKYYGITPDQYKNQVEGLKWYSCEQQTSDKEYHEWLDAFGVISDVKFINGRISRKPDVSECIDHSLAESL